MHVGKACDKAATPSLCLPFSLTMRSPYDHCEEILNFVVFKATVVTIWLSPPAVEPVRHGASLLSFP